MDRKNEIKHPLAKYSEDAKVAYLSLLAAICHVDEELSDEERKLLDELMAQLEISVKGKGRVYSAIFNLLHHDKDAHVAQVHVLDDSELKFSLISDLCLLADIDGEFSREEYAYIYQLAADLHVTPEQVGAIVSAQKEIKAAAASNLPDDRLAKAVENASAGLAGVGVPVAALAASGTVAGLGATGITSGLAALGGLVGGGMLAGVLVVPAIAIGSAFGVKKLFSYMRSKES